MFLHSLTGDSYALIYFTHAYGKLKMFEIFFHIFLLVYFIDTISLSVEMSKKS